MKKWRVELDSIGLCAEKSETLEVAANTERKAKIFAKEKMNKRGIKYFRIVSVTEVK